MTDPETFVGPATLAGAWYWNPGEEIKPFQCAMPDGAGPWSGAEAPSRKHSFDSLQRAGTGANVSGPASAENYYNCQVARM